MDLSALGIPGMLFSFAHVGLTQLIRQFAKWRGKSICDQWAVFLSLILGAFMGWAMLQGVAVNVGLSAAPPDISGGLLGLFLAAANSGVINKINGFQKDAARYRGEAMTQAGMVLESVPLSEMEMRQMTEADSKTTHWDAPMEPPLLDQGYPTQTPSPWLGVRRPQEEDRS